MLEPGTYTLTFDVAAYDEHSFFPQVALTFRVTDERAPPRAVAARPFAYSTYRGS